MSADRIMKKRAIAIRNRRKSALSHARTRRRLWPTAEDGIGGVSGTTFEIAAAEMTLGFHVADHGLDGGASSQFAFDDAEDAAILSGDEDAARVLRVMTAVTLVDIAALDLAAFWVSSRRV